ncbi:MAG: ribulokinase [Oscillospiraceae bacterium]|nr:ribulokinase [Oscillospiraceae bacterium]
MPYTIGLDFGSLSCRGVLADVKSGRIAAEAEFAYPHRILTDALPDGTPLSGDWCLQHPGDYLAALDHILPALLRKSGIASDAVIGIGVDFTASTVMAVDENFRPLCETYPSRPHAWPKLWKHHGARKQAEKLTALCKAQAPQYLAWYGGKISPESLTAKVLQVFEEDPEIFRKAHSFVEAMDYITSLLCGKAVFGASAAVAKAMYSAGCGYPGADFFGAYHPSLGKLPEEKLAGRYEHADIAAPWEKAGSLCPEMAARFGLKAGIAVSAPQMDAYAAMPGIGIAKPGVMLLVVGTSTGIMLLSKEKKCVEGVTACLPDTYYPGLWGYGSGQASVGDAFGWFVENCVPEAYRQAAQQRKLSLHQYLTELAATLRPGESGLLALDWLGGNRSCLGNPSLSGLVLGLTLQTKPEHIYRALLEATAFGARVIVEAYRQAGVPVEEIRVCGGIANKNPLMMQIYADVLGLPLMVSRCTQAPALGAAIYAAAAAGVGDIFEMVQTMSNRSCTVYEPDSAHRDVYNSLFREYRRLHDCFGRGENTVMERLRAIAQKERETL